MDRPFRFAAVIREAVSARDWAEKARRLEDSGFDVLLVPDHLVGPRFAPVAAMTAAACATGRLRVGTLVLADDLRRPEVLAEQAATVDLLSEGRLELGLGTGWTAADYASAGLAFEPPGVRVDRLAEAVAVLKGLWAEGPFTFHGEHYRITGPERSPRPWSRPHPRLLLGGGDPRLLGLAAREADVVDIGTRVRADGTGTGTDGADGGRAAFLAGIDVVRRAAGDRYDRIELGTGVHRVGARRREGSWSAAGSFHRDETPRVLLGTRHDIADTLRHWRDAHDVSYFVLHHERDLDAFTPVVQELAGR
ncbi:TIGR03621 family F420-dependent LLM class oxidoreductase [Streptosporangium sp. NPDC050855]|uniref:TIGR03621 family F420-dependent LLM class oxidoreductase n=1 Tax=Streptosporangium sp. NPDC050855 TaxID=3366194 RepID=UPI00379731B4